MTSTFTGTAIDLDVSYVDVIIAAKRLSMKLEVKQNCPLNDFNPCKQFDCSWFMKISGQTQMMVSLQKSGVALWRGFGSPYENAQQSRQTGAAVESFRNEMVEANKVSQAIAAITSGAAKKLTEA